MLGRHFLKTKYDSKIVGFVFFLLLPLLIIDSLSWADSTDNIAWQQLQTKTTLINYQSLDALKKFDNKIKFGKSKWGLKTLISPDEPETLPEKIKKKIDALYERVQEILDMRKTMEKVTINIYSDRGQLDAAYFNIYKNKCNIRAWYIYEYNTIYINANDLHEGMLAHEMAHAIIDHFLSVRPPAASAEILARYVDSHLHD